MVAGVWYGGVMLMNGSAGADSVAMDFGVVPLPVVAKALSVLGIGLP